MSRKYSAWASNQPVSHVDASTMRLTTITGNEQDQLKNIERVEANPHMYINIDAPPPPTTKIDARIVQPTVTLSRKNSSYFAAPTMLPPPLNSQTKIWPNEKSSKNSSTFESASATSKRHHRHKHHHHHHHHGDKHHHHHHHSRNHRAKSVESIRHHRPQSAESIRNRQYQMIVNTPQYLEQDQQQQQLQQQPMIVYREVGNGEGYTVDPNGLATVPYTTENETAFIDDQQAPMFVYQDQQPIINNGTAQQVFFNPEQETIVQHSDPFVCLPQQQSSQIVYYTDPNHQIVQQSMSPTPQQQLVCLDNTPTTAIQPTIINQIPVFNSLSSTTVPQTSLQRTASVVIQQQPQPFQIIQQQQQQPQQVQVVQQPQPVQVVQQPQQVQFLQLPQVIQTVQPQVVQAQPVLQTIQMPTQTVAANPQILYQRPYDPVVVPIQNQQVAVANSPLVALSQPSYAPSRMISANLNGQPQGPNMFRHALLRTVADRTGVLPTIQSTGEVQLVQPTGQASVAASPNLLMGGGVQQSASLPIVPLTPGGLLIPFQPSQTSGIARAGVLSRSGGNNPSVLRNFNDIRQQLQQKHAQKMQNLQLQEAARAPSPPVLSAAPRLPPPISATTPYASGLPTGRTPFPPLPPSNYSGPPFTGLSYAQPSLAGSIAGSATSVPYQTFRT